MVVRALIVLAALFLVLTGVAAGRLLERRRADHIDPQTYREMSNFVRLVLGAQPVDDPAYIPQWMKDEGQPVLRKIESRRRLAP